jgi:Arm domain-containing DNA-binding protein/integrase-like protein
MSEMRTDTSRHPAVLPVGYPASTRDMSTRKAFTDIGVRAMKAAPERREIPDPGASNLYLVIQPSGRKGYAVRYRFAGKPRKFTLPPGIGLAAARVFAADAMLEVAQGRDPGEARKTEQDRAAAAAENTLRAVAENYMRQESGRLRSRKDRQSILDRLVYPKLGDKPIGEIERDEIVTLLDKIAGKLRSACG